MKNSSLMAMETLGFSRMTGIEYYSRGGRMIGYIGVIWGYIGIMEKRMKTTVV